METIQCQHCNTKTRQRRANQKWCPTCRFLKAVVALSEYPATCQICDSKYYKLDRKSRNCPECRLLYTDGETLVKPCAICGAAGPGPLAAVALCYRCLGNPDPKVHSQVLKGIKARLNRAAA